MVDDEMVVVDEMVRWQDEMFIFFQPSLLLTKSKYDLTS